MTRSLRKNAADALPAATNVLFALFLLTEWLFKHTLFSQAALFLFSAAILLGMLLRKKVFLHGGFLFFALMIAWGLLGCLRALRPSTAFAMVRTLAIDLVFLYLFYQYLLSEKPGTILTVYLLSGCAFLLLTVLMSMPHPLEDRLGQKAGVNPNDVAIIAGTVFAIALCFLLGDRGVRPRETQLLWGLFLLPMLAVVFFTSSLKGYLLIAGVLCLYTLFRFPKKRGLKLLLFFLATCAVLYVLTMEGFLSRWPGIYYRITIRLQLIVEYLKGGGRHRSLSILERSQYFSIGARALARRPLLGWGLNCFRFLDGAGGTYSHNNYIELLVSGGWPMLLLYYAPYVLAIVYALRGRSRSRYRSLLLALTLVQLPLDFAMVSYFDRATLILPVMLYAENARAKGPCDRLPKIRRFLQNPYRLPAAAGSRGRLKLLPTRLYLAVCYRGRTGKRLRLGRPLRMTEKLQWMKLYDRDPRYPMLADKMAVRSYVRERAGDGVLTPLLGAWDRAEDIDFSLLPDRFVLKCTHDSGGTHVCTDKAAFDTEEAISFLNAHLFRNYYWRGREWWYRRIPARILAEEFYGPNDGTIPDDYKFFCFGGKVRAILYCTNRHGAHADYYFLNPDFSLLPVNDLTLDAESRGVRLEAPPTLGEMTALAETLSAGIRQVRVDLFTDGKTVRFGEMTLCDQSGFADDYTEEGDLLMGSWYELPPPKRERKQ